MSLVVFPPTTPILCMETIPFLPAPAMGYAMLTMGDAPALGVGMEVIARCMRALAPRWEAMTAALVALAINSLDCVSVLCLPMEPCATRNTALTTVMAGEFVTTLLAYALASFRGAVRHVTLIPISPIQSHASKQTTRSGITISTI